MTLGARAFKSFYAPYVPQVLVGLWMKSMHKSRFKQFIVYLEMHVDNGSK